MGEDEIVSAETPETPSVETATDSDDWKASLKREMLDEISQQVKDAVQNAIRPVEHGHDLSAHDDRTDQDMDLASDMEKGTKHGLGTILMDADSLERALE